MFRKMRDEKILLLNFLFEKKVQFSLNENYLGGKLMVLVGIF